MSHESLRVWRKQTLRCFRTLLNYHVGYDMIGFKKSKPGFNMIKLILTVTITNNGQRT